MFIWLDMIGNYDERKVKRDDAEMFSLDTATVTDREQMYETAVSHKQFNDSSWIILGWADTEDEAVKFHDEWLEKLNNGVDTLTDVFTGETYYKEEV